MRKLLNRSTFAPLEGGELDIAVRAIARAGLARWEFSLEERKTHAFPLRGGTVHKLVSVKQLGSGRQRQYVTGRGGGWPFEFERDLQCGFFSPPWPTAPGAPVVREAS